MNPAGSLTTGCYVGPPTAAFPQGAPSFCSNPAVAQNNSLRSLDLVRRMQDYDLTLLPQSKVRLRLGYSRNRDEGPSLFTTDSGTISAFNQANSYTTNAYRVGVDVHVLPRTTLSFDEFLSYYRQDNVISDNQAVNPGNFGFILGTVPGQGTPAGTPVDLGNIWSTLTPSETLPCATPVVAGTTNTATPTCNGFLSYSQVADPRNFMPTERFRFQSNYFKNFETSGSVGYSSSDYHFSDLDEVMNGWTARSAVRGTTAGGPVKTKRVSVNADWSGVYAVNDKLRIVDMFRYDNWRIPGVWDTADTTIFGTPSPAPGVVGMLLAPGTFNATNCPAAPYNQASCPQHTASSAADVTNEIAMQFLAQNIKSNTFELQYDFSRRYSAHVGYLYTNRTIASADQAFDTGEFYFPGGAAGNAGNFFLAARGDCALVAGVLPAGCTQITTGPMAGAIVEGSPANPLLKRATIPLETSPRSMNKLCCSVWSRVPSMRYASLAISSSVTTTNRSRGSIRGKCSRYKIHATYKPRPWVNLDAAVDINENRDNVSTVNNLEHDRSYSFSAMFMGNQHLAVDFGYNYWNVYTQSLICFAYSTTSANPAPPPATADGVRVSYWRAAASRRHGLPDRGLAFAAGGAFNLQQQG